MLWDPRIYQILFLAIFWGYSLSLGDQDVKITTLIVALGTCCLTQLAGAAWTRAEPIAQPTPAPFPLGWHLDWQISWSPVITALGLSLLLRSHHPSVIGLAAGAAIASKFLLRVAGKHLFNPANFGIIVALITQQAWVSPGQWGTTEWFGLEVLTLGSWMVLQVGRWDSAIGFLGVYAGLEALRNLWLGWEWQVWAHHLMPGSLLIFALFMITDPRSSPDARGARLLWASAIALLAFLLRYGLFLPTATFWALFLLSPLTPWLDRGWPADRFVWKRSSLITPP